ncbi:MAG: Gfo/Idh/MocA family oxidoreductase [Betaproteobacteria bacterium]|nr:Gfo/Idh/MocA family oxidoreductase [Betaproteobacteria bacterium]
MIRAAIVGLGWWGKTLVEAVHGKSDKIQFVAANTRTRAKAEDFCKERKIDLRDDLDAVLKDAKVDALVYATPHSMHEEHIKRAAAAGKHVYVEKPFALKVASAKAAIDAVKKAGVVLGVDFQRRFHPSVGEIRKRIKDGSLGTLTFAVGEVSSPGGLALAKESWRVNPEETPAGAMTGLGVHLVDGFIDLIGEVDEVYCVNTRRAAPLVDDTTVFTMKHKNGVVSINNCTLASAASYCIAVFGTKGIAETTRPALDTFRFMPVPDKGGPHATAQPETIENKGFNPVKAGLEAFADACSGNAKFPVTFEQIIHGVAVFEAIVESAKTGKPVKVK